MDLKLESKQWGQQRAFLALGIASQNNGFRTRF
jgi:hypothetical protein